MDEHLKGLAGRVRRVLETVWYIHTSLMLQQVADYAEEILSPNDGLLVLRLRTRGFGNCLSPLRR